MRSFLSFVRLYLRLLLFFLAVGLVVTVVGLWVWEYFSPAERF